MSLLLIFPLSLQASGLSKSQKCQEIYNYSKGAMEVRQYNGTQSMAMSTARKSGMLKMIVRLAFVKPVESSKEKKEEVIDDFAVNMKAMCDNS